MRVYLANGLERDLPTTFPAAAGPCPNTTSGCKGIDSSQRLGRHRWVVERTLSWLARYRRLTVRCERRAAIPAAFLTLGRALISSNGLP